MQNIWIVKIPSNDSLIHKERLFKYLPSSLLSRAHRYLDTKSALSFLTGRLLLKKALVDNGLPELLIDDITYTAQGKPILTMFYFSISHSDWYVSLSFSTTFSVGIDIERRADVDLKLFKYLFTAQEWKTIIEASDPLEKFYWFWVRKEALLKAVGASLKELQELKIFENYGMYKEEKFYFTSFRFDPDFNGVVATHKKVSLNVEIVAMEDLLL